MTLIRHIRRRTFLVILLLIAAATHAHAQEQSTTQDEEEVVKVDTNLVSFPVVVTTRTGAYIADLRKEELTIEEDGARQEIVFFGPVSRPFRVVLMIDTSASTEQKIAQIQRAARSFIEQLQPGDRVKVISFDEEVRELNEFTNDKDALRRAIDATRPGKGTKLYDAVQLALRRLRGQPGRKAVVIFTDGVDMRSVDYREHHNLRSVEESDVIVYPIRFETRAETERLARRQAAGGGVAELGKVITSGGSTGGATPTTFPSEERNRTVDILTRLPTIIPPQPYPGRTDPRQTGRREPDARMPDDRGDKPEVVPAPQRSDDGIGRMLDALYETADAYLEELARRSGGRLVRADDVAALPSAFEQIAAELRTQYYVGYYPTKPVSAGRYRKVRIRTTRKDAAVRARPGYTAVKATGGSVD